MFNASGLIDAGLENEYWNKKREIASRQDIFKKAGLDTTVFDNQLKELEESYTKARKLVDELIETERQRAEWAAQPIVYLYEPGYEPKV